MSARDSRSKTGQIRTMEKRYSVLASAFLDRPGVSQLKRKGFGSSALTIRGKIFAMLDSDKRFVVKLPRHRVDALVASGEGERFDPWRDGREMKEWFVVGPESKLEWLALGREAAEFVGASSK